MLAWGIGWVMLVSGMTGSSVERAGGHRWVTQEEFLLLVSTEWGLPHILLRCLGFMPFLDS